jgi:hypothetical protein
VTELLSALGSAWPRLLFFPGGLSAVLAALALHARLQGCGLDGTPSGTRSMLQTVIDIVPPLTVLTLLPLPPARSFPYGIDLALALALLEWPYLRMLAVRGQLAQTLAQRMPAYAMLLLAAGGMAEAVGSIGLSDLIAADVTGTDRWLLSWSALVWIGTLPTLLEHNPLLAALRLRGLGLLAVGSLPLLGWLAPALPEVGRAWTLVPLGGLLIGSLFGFWVRLWRFSSPERRRLAALTGAGGILILLVLGDAGF